MTVIATFSLVALDCPDTDAPARFDAAITAFQQVDGHRPPVWPGAEERLLAIGARKHPVQPGTTFRVYLDPAGHPSCLVLA